MIYMDHLDTVSHNSHIVVELDDFQIDQNSNKITLQRILDRSPCLIKKKCIKKYAELANQKYLIGKTSWKKTCLSMVKPNAVTCTLVSSWKMLTYT